METLTELSIQLGFVSQLRINHEVLLLGLDSRSVVFKALSIVFPLFLLYLLDHLCYKNTFELYAL